MCHCKGYRQFSGNVLFCACINIHIPRRIFSCCYAAEAHGLSRWSLEAHQRWLATSRRFCLQTSDPIKFMNIHTVPFIECTCHSRALTELSTSKAFVGGISGKTFGGRQWVYPSWRKTGGCGRGYPFLQENHGFLHIGKFLILCVKMCKQG